MVADIFRYGRRLRCRHLAVSAARKSLVEPPAHARRPSERILTSPLEFGIRRSNTPSSTDSPSRSGLGNCEWPTISRLNSASPSRYSDCRRRPMRARRRHPDFRAAHRSANAPLTAARLAASTAAPAGNLFAVTLSDFAAAVIGRLSPLARRSAFQARILAGPFAICQSLNRGRQCGGGAESWLLRPCPCPSGLSTAERDLYVEQLLLLPEGQRRSLVTAPPADSVAARAVWLLFG